MLRPAHAAVVKLREGTILVSIYASADFFLKISCKIAESKRGIKREVVGAGICSSNVNDDRHLALKHVIKSKIVFAIKAAEYFVFEERQ